MNTEQQRIAIAEIWPKIVGLSSSGAWMWSNAPGVWHCCYPDNCPLSDLNAMHQIWKSLTRDQKYEYLRHIMFIGAREAPNRGEVWMEEIAADFGPEAFLRTVGRWVE